MVSDTSSVLFRCWAYGSRCKSILFNPFFSTKTAGAAHFVCAGSTIFWYDIFSTMIFSTSLLFGQHCIKSSRQVFSFRRQVRCDVLLYLCGRRVHSISICLRLTWKCIRRGVRTICLKSELYVVSPALNAKSRQFDLKCGATFVIVCLQQVYSVLQRHWNKVQLMYQREHYLPRGLNWRNFLTKKVESVYNVWRFFALCDYHTLG